MRRLPIAQGRSKIEFPDVSAQIRPETLSFAAEGAGIVEQNFDFDLLTPQKLMEKAIGQTVTLIRTNPAPVRSADARLCCRPPRRSGEMATASKCFRPLPVRTIFDRVPSNLPRAELSVTVVATGARPPASIRISPQAWPGGRLRRAVRRGPAASTGGLGALTPTGTTFTASSVLVAGSPGQ